jgi:hypothetical protein
MTATTRTDIVLLRYLYRYWNGARAGRQMPLRSEIDLLRLPGLLPKLMLIEASETAEGPRFRYAMLGSELVQRFGRDVTGRWVHEALEGEHREFMLGLYGESWRTRQPAMAASEYISANEVAFMCQRLVLPLSEDGIAVSQLLGIQVFLPGAPGMTKLAFRDHSIRNLRLARV